MAAEEWGHFYEATANGTTDMVKPRYAQLPGDGLNDFRHRLQMELKMREISPEKVAESWQVPYSEESIWAQRHAAEAWAVQLF